MFLHSEDDFSLVSTATAQGLDGSVLSPLDSIRKEIEKYKEICDQIITDQNDLRNDRDKLQQMTEEFKLRSVKLKQQREDEEVERSLTLDTDKEKLAELQLEEQKLQEEAERLQTELRHVDEMNQQLKQETQVTTAVPERKVVFTGATGEEGSSSFDMNPRIVYPMEGGTALITFEDEEVAQKILSMNYHDVQLGECSIRLEARPVQLLMPSYIEVETHVSNRRILVSNLPKDVEESRLLDKLELFFSKSRNGGGEVESLELLHDSGTVVITFLEDTIAKRLTDMENHTVELLGKKYRLRVTPFLNGKIIDLQTRVSESRRTVQLVGIPNIMEEDNMQDNLEIHFQKSSNGGGEVDAFLYSPPGKTALAVFEEDSPESA
uniref:Interferon-induced protein 35 n=1 Tax=Lepisosteus oculatus TaxID=7918 RepID=W5N357_LEPOC